MTPTHVISELDAMLALSLTQHRHFETLTEGGLLCRICATLWADAEAWAADSGVCPGQPR